MHTAGLNREPTYSIGEAARMLGISTHSLRVYEREGFILSQRTESGRRYYSEIEVAKVRNIMRLIRDEGLNFNSIRKILSLIPCWAISGRSKSECAECAALRQNSQPCWALEEKCNQSEKKCGSCPVYQSFVNLGKLKMQLFFSSF